MSLFSRHDARKQEQPQRQHRVSTAELAAVDTEPGDVPVGDARHHDDAAVPLQVAPGEDREGAFRAAAARATHRNDNVEDAVEPVRTERRPDSQDPPRATQHRPQPIEEQRLAPLFSPGVTQDFRARWDATQMSFVDDPRLAVKQADELVAQMMQSLAKSFADERTRLEAQMNETASTENLRVALQRYRSFFQRLLSL